MALQKEGSQVRLHIPAQQRGGWGQCPGGSLSLALERCPSQLGSWCFKGKALLACCLWGSQQQLTNPLQFAPTNPACSLGGRESFFTQSCAQLCLRETALAGHPRMRPFVLPADGKAAACSGWAEAGGWRGYREA
jgi:hypothetical protein